MNQWIHETGKYVIAASPLFLLVMAVLPAAWLDRQPRKAARLGLGLALGSLMASVLAVSLLVLGGPVGATFLQAGLLGLGIYYDTLSGVLLLLVSLLAAVILRYSENYMAGDPRQGHFTRWLCLTSGSVLVLVAAGNLLLFAAAWISVSLCLHRLLVFYPDRPAALLAARKKFIFSRLGDGCLLGAMLLIYLKFGTFDLQELFQRASLVAGGSSGDFAGIGFLLVACALLKSAQFPFHSWLPDTMETPTPVSALMHAGVINAGGFLIVRLSAVVVLSPEALMLLVLVGGFTALFASLTMLTHASIKRALAFSTVAQMGFMMLECGLGAFSLAVLHLTAHSLYKAHAFLNSGSILQLSRSAWVPDSLPRTHPLALGGTLTATALLSFGSAWMLGLDLWKSPGTFFLGLVFWFSLAYMLWNLWSHSSGAMSVVAGLVMAGVISVTGFALHLLFDSLLAPVLPVPKVGWDWTMAALAAFPFALFLAVLVFQTQLPVWYRHPMCGAFYVHARNGFYFTTLANRLVAAIWPIPSRPTSIPLKNPMNNIAEYSPVGQSHPVENESSTKGVVEEACRRIPPLWPLKDFVAVNPFLGLSNLHFLKAAALLRSTAHGDIFMPESYYLQRLDAGDITDQDIREAVALAEKTLPSPWLQFLGSQTGESLRRELSSPSVRDGTDELLTVADCLDQYAHTQWASFVTEEISKWCSVYFDEGQSSWRMPWREQPFYSAWREAARHDANPALSGLRSFARIVRILPQDPGQAIEQALQALEIPSGKQSDFLHRQLLSVSGWSSYVQYQVRQKEMRGEHNQGLAELLAVRLAYDLALKELGQSIEGFDRIWRGTLDSMQECQPALGLLPRYLFQLALDKGGQRRLAASLRSQSGSNKGAADRAALHAIFCIDVRSEIFRRHLETQDTGIRTSGFAGFFGMPIEYIPLGQEKGSAQCPVLLSPAFKVREGLSRGGEKALVEVLRRKLFKGQVNYSWNSFKTSAVSCFSFVETSGLLFGLKLGRDALAWNRNDGAQASATRPQLGRGLSSPDCLEAGPLDGCGIPAPDRIDLAENALRNLGLTTDFARLVLFCGHGSATTNNPYAASLDCGACGGHAGHVNARIAADILNEPTVREGLGVRGIVIPDDTHFVAGQHNTTTDDVELFEERVLPISHREEWQRMGAWLQEASRLARRERSPRLGLQPEDGKLEQKIRARSHDWAQVRPEWGLAGNAALIAAPRERTKGLNLGGRTFLHDYDQARDPEGKVLELILTAPVVVANWINLQYYASTVNNRLFGSGNKTIHNLVGALGIWQGNGGDLQTGLPLQSLHDGESWTHEPLRLAVFLEASREKIDQVLHKHPQVAELADNQWLFLLAMEDDGSSIFQYIGQERWELLP